MFALATNLSIFPTARPVRYPRQHDHTTTLPNRRLNDLGNMRANGMRSVQRFACPNR
jgi:hypothetical protein